MNFAQQRPIFQLPSYSYQRHHHLILAISIIAFAQFLLHLGAMNRYGFHQDELLYLALSKHLDWGYRETPPFIAFAGWLGQTLFGDSLLATRLIPAFCAGAIVHLTGLITMRLGGKLFAVLAACIGVAFSSAFLATGALFIPQVFDELMWVLIAYLFICYLQQPRKQLLVSLAFAIGIGLLVKYTLLIYLAGLFTGLWLYRPARKIIGVGSIKTASLIAFALVLPHLIWQFQHNFPALGHYHELRSTQLNYLKRSDFILQQLVVHGTGIILWPAGIYFLFRDENARYLRFLAYGFFSAILILLLLNGKPYYAFGAFPPLFAAGAVYYEKRWQFLSHKFRVFFLLILLLPNLLLSMIVLPYLPVQNAAKVLEWTYVNLNIHFPLKWEDQKIHNMNQNYADMIGWEELAQKTSALYRAIPPQERKQTVIFTDNYGEAGAIDHYREFYPLPKVISLCSSYALWAPDHLSQKNMIYISAGFELPSQHKYKILKYGQINNTFSRIYGMDIYLIRNIDNNIKNWYRKEWEKTRNRKPSISRNFAFTKKISNIGVAE